MAKKKIYFSYNYEKDENRVNEIRDMGVVYDIKPASKEEWKILLLKNGQMII